MTHFSGNILKTDEFRESKFKYLLPTNYPQKELKNEKFT